MGERLLSLQKAGKCEVCVPHGVKSTAGLGITIQHRPQAVTLGSPRAVEGEQRRLPPPHYAGVAKAVTAKAGS